MSKLFCPVSKCVEKRVLSSQHPECILWSLNFLMTGCSFYKPVTGFSFPLATTCLQTRSHRRQDWTELFSLQYIVDY